MSTSNGSSSTSFRLVDIDAVVDDSNAYLPGQNEFPAHVKVKTFYGNTKFYAEWKREVQTLKALYSVPEARMAGLVYLALSPGEGRPRDLLSHLRIQDITSEKGYVGMFEILDGDYERETYRKADDAQAKWERCVRKPNQRMDEYIRELKIARRLMETEDEGSKISDISFARKLLRKCGLTRLEQRGVLSAAGAIWDARKIEDALRLMYNDAHLEDGRRRSEQSGRQQPQGSSVSALRVC